jgi:hypothetical protein
MVQNLSAYLTDLSQLILCIPCKPKFHYRFYNDIPLDPILRQVNLLQSCHLCDIVVPNPKSSKRSLSFKFQTKTVKLAESTLKSFIMQ